MSGKSEFMNQLKFSNGYDSFGDPACGYVAPPDPSRSALVELAVRLTPNPARTVAGTLAIILDAIDRLDEEKLARTIGYVSAREQGLDVQPVSDEQWANTAPEVKQQLIYNAQALKIALREMAG